MIRRYSTLKEVVMPAVKDVGRTVRDIALCTVIALTGVSGIGYARDSLASYKQEQKQERFQKRIEDKWIGYFKDGGRERVQKEIERDVSSTMHYFSDSVDLEKKVLALPDEVKFGEKTIDLVDSSEVPKYGRKVTVKYIFSIGDKKITETGIPIPDIAVVLSGSSRNKYESAEKALSKTSEVAKEIELNMDSLSWAFGLAEADKFGAIAYSASRANTTFRIEETKEDQGNFYSARFSTIPEVTFYFKEGEGRKKDKK